MHRIGRTGRAGKTGTEARTTPQMHCLPPARVANCTCIMSSAAGLSSRMPSPPACVPSTKQPAVHAPISSSACSRHGAGRAHTFFSGETDKPRAGELINVLREAGQPVPEALLAFGTTVKKKESKL